MPEAAHRPLAGKTLRNAQSRTERLDEEADAETFAAVRALLIGDERADIESLRARVQRIEGMSPDLDRRRDEVAEVLGEALRQASLTDGDKIEDVLNPTIGEGIRHQLKTERPAMVAALVPMVGTLVTGAVAEAIGKLSSSINDRVEKLLSFDGLKLALRARLSNRSVTDLLLSELRKTEVERVYLFEREGEKLVFSWPDDGDPTLSNAMAEEVLRSVLAFSSGILDTGDHGLRSIAIRDRHLVVQASDAHIVIIEVSGALSDQRRGSLNAACFDLLTFASDLTGDLHDVAIDQDAMHLFAARIAQEERQAQHKTSRRVSASMLLAGVLLLLLVGFAGWRAYDSHRIHARAAAIEAHVTESFPDDALMLSVTPLRATGTIAVLGVALSDGDRAAIRDQAAALAAPYVLKFDLVASDPDRSAPRIDVIEADLLALQDRATAMDASLGEARAAAAQAQAKADALWAAQRQLEHWIASHAVFFSEGTAYRAPERVAADLDVLAALLNRAPGRPLRIVGYSDLIGSDRDNRALARARANAIGAGLIARGIAPERLVLLGRTGSEKLISARNGPTSPNRRAEFALGFVGEGQ